MHFAITQNSIKMELIPWITKPLFGASDVIPWFEPSMTTISDTEFQPLPTTGALARHLNSPLSRLRAESTKSLGAQGQTNTVYAFVLTSFRLDEASRLRQRGSGPNFAADLLTLTTCKHQLRAARSVKDWPGAWVVGLTSSGLHEGHQWICFAAQIERAYASHLELWKALPASQREAKAADISVHGDLFRPRRGVTATDALKAHSYRAPVKGHRHERPEQWGKDIGYQRWSRPAALLVGDPQRTYLWSEPSIYYSAPIGRGYTKFESLSDFLTGVRSAP